MMILMAAAIIAATTVTAPGPNGPLEGALVHAGKGAPVVVIIPGSGPTDRDGNSPLGVKAQPYELLADALAERGVSSIRIDKRGMFGSKAAILDPNKVTIADYAADAHAWAKVARKATGARCAWIVGHSEGGLVALKAGQDKSDICGVVTVSAMGRRMGAVLREQFAAAGLPAPMTDQVNQAIGELEAGRTVDATKLPPGIAAVFNPAVQPFLIDFMAQDSAALAGSLKRPLLIVQGDRDIQVKVGDARMLAAAQPKAKLVIVPKVNHVLKTVESDDRTANVATYMNGDLPISEEVVTAIADFVKAKR